MITAPHDAEICARIAHVHARTFALASRFLPPGKRRAAFAIYAFCRTADDLVDADGVAAQAAATALRDYEHALDRALAGNPADAVFRELARAIESFAIPRPVLHDLLWGVARDLAPSRYASWSALARYCEGVASSVGEMCVHVFGVAGNAAALDCAVRYARTLGVAMQLTNILRDVGEDAARGRCYLPDDELTAFGLSRVEVLAGDTSLARDERWRALMAFQIGRARSLYEAAAPGIALLAPDSRRCAIACATGYAAILNAIESQAYDTLTRRARVGRAARVGLLWHAWREGGRSLPVAAHARGPLVHWDATSIGGREATRWA